MKKYLVLMLATIMAFSLFGCADYKQFKGPQILTDRLVDFDMKNIERLL